MTVKHNPELVGNARQLRKNMTAEERILWYQYLRTYPVKFYRQRTMGHYIVDFYCAKARLVVEIDGSQHYEDRGLEYGFADGTKVTVPFIESANIYKIGDLYLRNFRWFARNRMRGREDVFETRQLNDSVAFLALRTFDLNQVQEDSVRAFLAGCDAPNLIVDLRNNAGGDVNVLMRLLSCLTDRPLDRHKG